MTDTRHTINESADKIRTKTKVKRGTGTRDQDEVEVTVKGSDPEDVAEDLHETVLAITQTADLARGIQPGVEEHTVVLRFDQTDEGLLFVGAETPEGEVLTEFGEWEEDGDTSFLAFQTIDEVVE